ncbi:uncharacterized protein LOC114941905 [Nylanderia fulva]|uniref:uncharacterized protein LOC114941905 n=1 Tax=Nylanderia fulva TaxID=613905 RepID=UPI0010FB43E6|nr:uncharacterized protein LOC114941905 [Nylanderia fulva]
MEKNSYASFSDYFDKLRHKTREIDKGIEQLSETWKMPQLLMGGYAERTVEVDACLDELSTQDINDKIKEFPSEVNSSLDDMDQFLNDSEKIYLDLKEQCDNLDIVLAEFGYYYKENDSMQEKHCRDDSKDSTNDSILRPETEGVSDLEIEFTPFLTWRCKAKSKEN